MMNKQKLKMVLKISHCIVLLYVMRGVANEQNPQLKITDLALDLVDKNICLYVANESRHDWNDRQLQIGSPEIRSRLLLFCNGDIQSSQQFYPCIMLITKQN